jgi:hypothetical protein
MQALPEHKYIRLGESRNIIPLVIKRDNRNNPINPTAYRDLKKILDEEFPGSMAGHLTENNVEREVILFNEETDCTAFLLKYGHIYATFAE